MNTASGFAISHLLFLTGSGTQRRPGHVSRGRDHAGFPVDFRVRAEVMSALHLIGVECPASPRPLAIKVSQPGLDLSPARGGLTRQALARDMTGPGRALWTGAARQHGRRPAA
jgi:hypothetical protein